MKVVENILDKFDESFKKPEKMIKDMIQAIEKEDEKKLLKYMKMDKKGEFNKRRLDYRVEDGEITKEQASKLGKLSIGIGHALAALDATLDKNKENRRKRALAFVKEVK